MDYLDIKYAINKAGYTLTRIAEELDLCGAQSISQVLTRKYISARVEQRVSQITGLPLHQLFPDRYSHGRAPKSGRASKT